MRVTLVLAFFATTAAASASDSDKVPLREMVDHTVEQSSLTKPGSKPFHLKAEIVETTNPASEYHANIEEYWQSPTQWRRTIESPGFSQLLIMNGDQAVEKDEGDYLAWWLDDLVTAMLDPLPMSEAMKRVNAQLRKPQGGEHSTTCADMRQMHGGVLCFEGSRGLLISAPTSGFVAEFQNFKEFGNKRVARVILIDPEPGTTIQARITELEEIRNADPVLFVVPNSTPLERRIKTIRVDDATVRKLASDPEVAWPVVENPPVAGECGVHIGADRTGRVREVWPAGCDNAELQDSLREIVKRWQLKPATENGVPVQIQAFVNFKFETSLARDHSSDRPPVQDATGEATTQANSHKGPPVLPPVVVHIEKPDWGKNTACHGIHGEVTVVVSVLEDGAVGDVTVRSGDPRLFDEAIKAAKKCTFRPGSLLGKSTNMNFNLKYEF